MRSAPRWQWNTIGYAVWSSTSTSRCTSVGAGNRFAENVMSSWFTFAACVVRHSSRYHGMLLHTPRRFTTVLMPFSAMNARSRSGVSWAVRYTRPGTTVWTLVDAVTRSTFDGSPGSTMSLPS